MGSAVFQLFPSGFYEPDTFYYATTPGTIVAAGANVRGIMVTGGSIVYAVPTGTPAISWAAGSLTIPQVMVPASMALIWDQSTFQGYADGAGDTSYMARLKADANILFQHVGVMTYDDYNNNARKLGQLSVEFILHYKVL